MSLQRLCTALLAACVLCAGLAACSRPSPSASSSSGHASSGMSAASSVPASSTGVSAPSSAASSFPSPESDPRYAKAYKAYMSDNYDEAESICDAAIAKDSNCFWAYNIKGIAYYFANGNSVADTCLSLIGRSVQINPSYGYGYFNRALIEKGLRRWDASLADFNKVLSLKPADTWSYYGIATVYADSNRNDLALQYLKLALDTDPAGVKAQAKDDLERHYSRLRHDPRFTALTGLS